MNDDENITINVPEEDKLPKLTLVRALSREKSMAHVKDEYQKMAILRYNSFVFEQ